MIKHGAKVAVIFIITAGLLMVLTEIVVIRSLYFGWLPLPPGEVRRQVTMMESMHALMGGIFVVVGFAVLTCRKWAHAGLLLLTIISLGVFAAGTWAGKFFFDWQGLSNAYRASLILYYSCAGYLLWTQRRTSIEA